MKHQALFSSKDKSKKMKLSSAAILLGAFPSLEWLQITKSVLGNFAIIRVLSFRNNPKNLDPSYIRIFMIDLKEKKTPSYNRRNTAGLQQPPDEVTHSISIKVNLVTNEHASWKK